MYIPTFNNSCFVNAAEIQMIYIECQKNSSRWYVCANTDYSDDGIWLAGPFETSGEAREELQRILETIDPRTEDSDEVQ